MDDLNKSADVLRCEIDLESGFGDRRRGLPIEMTHTLHGEPSWVKRIGQPSREGCPAAHAVQQDELHARPQNAPDFGESILGPGDAAEDQRAQHRVERIVGERELLDVGARRREFKPWASLVRFLVGRHNVGWSQVDGRDRYVVTIMSDICPSARADLERVAGHFMDDPLSEFRQLGPFQ